jgi:hypothetical protein
MARNNDVFQVLVTKSNQSVLGAGNKVTALSPGQIGVFDANTNLSVSSLASVRDFYLAVGLDLNGDSATDEVMKSAGEFIQKRNIKAYSFRPHSPGRPMKIVLKDYTADCETEYGVKLELRNQEIYRTQGYNQFTKTYSIKTSCCSGCTPTCPSGDANEITKLLKININNDPSGLITSYAVARQALTAATHGVAADLADGATVSDADLLAIMAFNAAQTDVADYVYTDLVIETVTQKLNAFCNVNLKYFYPRETVVIAAPIEGFKCNGTIEVLQEVAFVEGSGYDLKQIEFKAKGWNESPYRLSTLNGVADEKVYQVDSTGIYDVFHLTYDEESQAAWLQYTHNLATTIAIPEADSTTLTGLVTILDTAVSGVFDALADDVAARNTTETTVETTTSKTVATDGIA